jgi:hypothetical protein
LDGYGGARLLPSETLDYLPRGNAEATSIVGKVQGCLPP